MSAPIVAFGLDLGSANLRLAATDGHHFKVVPTEDGNPSEPAAVTIWHEELVHGSRAVKRGVTHAASTVLDPLGAAAAGGHFVDGRYRGPDEILGWVLEHALQWGFQKTECGGGRLCACSARCLREAIGTELQAAAFRVGADLLGTLAPTTATALAFSVMHNVTGGSALIVDAGASKVEAAVVRFTPGRVLVAACRSDITLGGRSLDLDLTHAFLGEIASPATLDRLDPSLFQIVARECETARIELGNAAETFVCLPFPPQLIGCDGFPDCRLSRSQFDALARPFVDRFRSLCEQVIVDAGITRTHIDHLVVVGGLSRMPAIRAALREVVPRAEVATVDPEGTVACGAAIMGAIRTGDVRMHIVEGDFSDTDGTHMRRSSAPPAGRHHVRLPPRSRPLRRSSKPAARRSLSERSGARAIAAPPPTHDPPPAAHRPMVWPASAPPVEFAQSMPSPDRYRSGNMPPPRVHPKEPSRPLPSAEPIRPPSLPPPSTARSRESSEPFPTSRPIHPSVPPPLSARPRESSEPFPAPASVRASAFPPPSTARSRESSEPFPAPASVRASAFPPPSSARSRESSEPFPAPASVRASAFPPPSSARPRESSQPFPAPESVRPSAFPPRFEPPASSHPYHSRTHGLAVEPSEGDFWIPRTAEEIASLPIARALTAEDFSPIALPILLFSLGHRKEFVGTLELASETAVLRFEIAHGALQSEGPKEKTALLAAFRWNAGTYRVIAQAGIAQLASEQATKLPRRKAHCLKEKKVERISKLAVDGLRSLLQDVPEDTLERLLGPKLKRAVRVLPLGLQAMSVLGFWTNEQRFLEYRCDGTMLGDGAIRSAGMSKASALQLLFLMDLFSYLAWEELPEGLVKTLEERVLERAYKAARSNYLQLLELHWTATPAEVRQAHDKLIAEFGPDTEAAKAAPGAAAEIVQRTREALKTLSDDRTRIRYQMQIDPALDYESLAHLLEGRAHSLEMRGDQSDSTRTERLSHDVTLCLRQSSQFGPGKSSPPKPSS